MTAAIFDIDGTLSNTTKVDDACFIQAFERVFKMDISNQDWSLLNNVTDWGITEEIILETHNRIPTATEYEQMKKVFLQLLCNELDKDKTQFQEIKGAASIIHLLKQRTDLVVGIATGAWEASASLKLKAIGINPNEFPFSNSSHFKKREEILLDNIQQAKSRTEQPIERIVYFGDGMWDFLTCKKLGIEFIGVDAQQNGKLLEIGAENILKDFSQPALVYELLSLSEPI